MTKKKPEKAAEAAEQPKHRLVDPTAERERATANRDPSEPAKRKPPARRK